MSTELTIATVTAVIVFFTQVGTAFSYYWKLREEILQLNNRVENLERVYPKIEKMADNLQSLTQEVKIITTKLETRLV